MKIIILLKTFIDDEIDFFYCEQYDTKWMKMAICWWMLPAIYALVEMFANILYFLQVYYPELFSNHTEIQENEPNEVRLNYWSLGFLAVYILVSYNYRYCSKILLWDEVNGPQTNSRNINEATTSNERANTKHFGNEV